MDETSLRKDLQVGKHRPHLHTVIGGRPVSLYISVVSLVSGDMMTMPVPPDPPGLKLWLIKNHQNRHRIPPPLQAAGGMRLQVCLCELGRPDPASGISDHRDLAYSNALSCVQHDPGTAAVYASGGHFPALIHEQCPRLYAVAPPPYTDTAFPCLVAAVHTEVFF